jgi:hypothetical protein
VTTARSRASALLPVLAATVALAQTPAGAPPSAPQDTATPPEHRRGTEQTFLTFPEWFLVHSPAEYAAYVRDHGPSGFPFLGHVGQLWQSYRTVAAAANDGYPVNVGYHVMIVVIATSTTAEYALRSAYENLFGRLTELASGYGTASEDRYAARVAQDYVDFIRVRPWYEYDFAARLRGLWTENPAFGPGMLRKWERRYALTTEYGAKAIYGWLIGLATRASYEEALPTTAVLLDALPGGVEPELTALRVLDRRPDGAVLATVPRYEAFKRYAATLARQGASFREIAGNRSVILVSLIVPAAWTPAGDRVLFTQPLLTDPARKRVALVVPVAALSRDLLRFEQEGDELEHVYDY